MKRPRWWRFSFGILWSRWCLGIAFPADDWQAWGLFVGPMVFQWWIKNGRATVMISPYSKDASS